MLFLHGGLPKTGTTSFQAMLSRSQDRLALAGVLYPDRWKSTNQAGLGTSHHGLDELLKSAEASMDALDEFGSFLAQDPMTHMVLSSELLGLWLHSEQSQKVLLRFLAVAQRATPTKCVWTMRRHDEVFESLYRVWLARGGLLAPPEEFVSREDGPIPKFTGMQKVEETLNGNVAYIKYAPSGAHNRELLSALGITGTLRTQLLEDLEDEQRQNISWTHKQVVALAHAKRLEGRAGVELDRGSLRSAFTRDRFTFEDDGPCILLDGVLRRSMRENALRRAAAQGFSPYVEFFQCAQVEEFPSASRLEPEVITDRDLSRLVAHLDARANDDCGAARRG